jgi:hypothetical protein
MHELDAAWRQVTARQFPAEAHKRGDEELDLVAIGRTSSKYL